MTLPPGTAMPQPVAAQASDHGTQANYNWPPRPSGMPDQDPAGALPVSYTHLTLPTICSV
eukprot:9565121-Karenia_brevis.AAC.1